MALAYQSKRRIGGAKSFTERGELWGEAGQRIACCVLRISNTFGGAPKENGADGLEKKVGEPEDEVRREFGTGFEGLAEENKAVINGHEHKRDADAYVRFAAMDLNAQRNPYQSKSKAREGERHLPMHINPNRRGEIGTLFIKALSDLGDLSGIRDAPPEVYP